MFLPRALTRANHRVFAFVSLQPPKTPETELNKDEFESSHVLLSDPCYFPFVPVSCSYIILLVYLFSLCLTALYSCSTEERGAEDFVCMQMSVSGGSSRRAELFDAWPSAERRGAVVERR